MTVKCLKNFAPYNIGRIQNTSTVLEYKIAKTYLLNERLYMQWLNSTVELFLTYSCTASISYCLHDTGTIMRPSDITSPIIITRDPVHAMILAVHCITS